MPTNYTWSYSSIELFKQCPHKYYRLKIKKDIREAESEAMRYGTEVHKAAELFVRDGVPIPNKFSFLQRPLEALKTKPGDKLCEHKMGLTRNLEPCEFFAPNVWFRGVVDLFIPYKNVAWVVDYKTGKSSKYADVKQLELMALSIFKHFPEVETIRAGLLFVIAGDFVKANYNKSEESVRWQEWLTQTARLEKALELNVWNPRPNFTCRGFCPVVDCVHNEQR